MRDRIDEIRQECITGVETVETKLTDRYNWFATRIFRLLLALVFIIGSLGTLSVWLTYQNVQRSKENKNLISLVQDERARNIRRTCQETNDRHDNTLAQLQKLALQLKNLPPRANKVQIVLDNGTKVNATITTNRRTRDAQIDNSVKQNFALINVLVPKQNCELVAQQNVKVTQPQPVKTKGGH